MPYVALELLISAISYASGLVWISGAAAGAAITILIVEFT